MSRDHRRYLRDMRGFAARCLLYVEGLGPSELFADQMRLDAVLRNLELLGEAAKRIPEGFRVSHPNVPWRQIAGLRDVLAHDYLGIDEVIIWEILSAYLPRLVAELDEMLKDSV